MLSEEFEFADFDNEHLFSAAFERAFALLSALDAIELEQKKPAALSGHSHHAQQTAIKNCGVV